MPRLEVQRRHEHGKYRTLYADRRTAYGATDHGRDAEPLLRRLGVNSLLDVGCGDNRFAGRARGRGLCAVGVDFAHPRADLAAAAHALPFRDDAFDWLTAFDVLEHLLPAEIDAVLREFARVARTGWLFSICYRDSRTRVCGETLHPTVRPEAWWRERLGRFIHVQKSGLYLYGFLQE